MLEVFSIYLGIFILGIGEFLFAKIILNKDTEMKKFNFVILFILAKVLITIIYIYFIGTLKTLMMCIIHFGEFKIQFNLNNLKALFLTFLYVVVLLVPDILLVVAVNVIKMDKIDYFNEFSGSIISNLISCIIIILITFIFRKLFRKIINTEISNNVKIVFLSVIVCLCSVSFLYKFAQVYKFDGNSLPYLITIGVLLIILFSLIRQTFINNKLTKEYDKLLEFMTSYENEIEKQRILRHETKNEFLAIKAKICDKQKNREIIEYIDEILKDKITINNEKYAKFGKLPPNGIKGLCYFKVQEAEDSGISVSINISSRIKKSSIYKLDIKNQRDLGKILGVFLDNAIEASKSSENKQLGLEFYVNKNGETNIIISNTFNNVINKSKIGKERFTTKGKDRGYGLLLVKHIVDKNKLYETKMDIVIDLYIQTLIIKKG